MTQEEIKKECDDIYREIERNQDRLAALRILCNHSVTFLGDYSWRVGVVKKVLLCHHCGTALEIIK